MILVIVGKTGSGKSTLLKKLCYFWNFSAIVPVTTRPMREGETDMIDYTFVNDVQFKQLEASGMFAEVTSYVVANDDRWYYGTLLDDWKDTGCNKVVILSPRALEKVRKNQDIKNYKTLYLDVPDSILRRRLVARGDDLEEINRRLADEAVIFNEPEIKSFDYVVNMY